MYREFFESIFIDFLWMDHQYNFLGNPRYRVVRIFRVEDFKILNLILNLEIVSEIIMDFCWFSLIIAQWNIRRWMFIQMYSLLGNPRYGYGVNF